MPGTFSGNDEMLALGLGMKDLPNAVFELVSDHLGEANEWAWVKEFQEQTGLGVTLIATSAEAYKDNMMYNLAEEARWKAMKSDRRPQEGQPAFFMAYNPVSTSLLGTPPGVVNWSNLIMRRC